MLFAKSAIALLAAASSALAIAIDTPSASSFWVQNTSNTISWSFSSSDPNPIDIVVTNSNSSILNGNFSIARFVDLSNGTFTVTNVTLTVGTGYVVNFVNTSNSEQVFAQSGTFDVKEPGTTPASVSSASATATSASGTNSGATSSASGTATDASSTSSAALRAVSLNLPAFPILISAGMALAGSLLVL
ncbi:hesp-379 [Pyrrhoderma noxium]|uniref:Hesp-379 n=1 Tax=Pyrrhoderma noxium TaxID=2282107 RepID=A0A286UVN3_9AGAM|nr:hesp-379 [Pyrrhoderma noxium]